MNRNRRKNDKSIEELNDKMDVQYELSQCNTYEIKRISSKLDRHIENTQPMVDILDDVAAVGRIGKHIKAITIWIVAITTSLLVAYEFVSNFMRVGK